MSMVNFFIHGNGFNSSLAPDDFLAVDMPGHHLKLWDTSLYNIDSIVAYFDNFVPEGAMVWGHSLGGHVALNLAQRRDDLSVVCFGMAPLVGPHEIGTVMTPPKEFGIFQNVDRTETDMIPYLNFSAEGNHDTLKKLIIAAKAQDPHFNEVLFTKGLTSYDWNEVEKCKALGDRFTLLLSKNEKVYSFDRAIELPLPIVEDDYSSHAPWLQDSNWIKKIQGKILLKKKFSLFMEEESRSTLL